MSVVFLSSPVERETHTEEGDVEDVAEQKCCAGVRLAAIDGVGGDTGVKPQHRLRHLHRPSPSF